MSARSPVPQALVAQTLILGLRAAAAVLSEVLGAVGDTDQEVSQPEYDLYAEALNSRDRFEQLATRLELYEHEHGRRS